MIWTFSTLGCPELNLDDAIKLAKKFDLSHLEIRTLEDRVDLPALFSEQFQTPENLAAKLKEEAITVISLDTSLKLVGKKPDMEQEFLAFIPWAEALGTPYLRVFDGGKFNPEISPENLAEAIETVKWWQALKAQNNWKCDITIETHDALTPSDACLKLQEQLDTPAHILWDTHHTWKLAGENPVETWAKLKPFVPHVHVKDSISKPSARHAHTYVMLGEGEFDLAGVVDLLKTDNYQGVASIEWERKWHPYLPELDLALARARELGWW